MKRKVSERTDMPLQTSKEESGGDMNENQIVVYHPNETVRLDVRLENRTVWLSQKQMAELFGCSSENIIVHLKKIYREEELSEVATAKENLVVQTEGNRTVSRRIKFYNLDAIISVGFRVNTKLGIQFRQWANGVIQSYLLKGYAINERLSMLEDRIDRRMAKTEQDVVELKEKVDFFVQTQTPPLQGVFYNGQLWDARVFVERLIRARFAASRSRHLHRSRKAYDPFSGRVALPRDRMESRRLGGATGITGVSPVAVERQQIGNTSRTAGERNRSWDTIRNSTANLRSKILTATTIS